MYSLPNMTEKVLNSDQSVSPAEAHPPAYQTPKVKLLGNVRNLVSGSGGGENDGGSGQFTAQF